MSNQQTIHRVFETQVDKNPSHIAAIDLNQSITYLELNQKANQLANHLRDIGIRPNVQVGICMDRSIDLLIVILGILKAGGAYLPLDPSHPQSRLLFTLEDNENPLLITHSDLNEKFGHYTGKLILWDQDKTAIHKHSLSNCVNDKTESQDLAYIIYTSGSTGTPKGVMIEHHSVVNYSEWFKEYSGCIPQQYIDFSSNYIFDMAVTTSIVPLMLGLTIVIFNDQTKKSPQDYLQALKKYHINITKMTPSYFKVLLHEIKNRSFSLPDLKSIILGGENLPTLDCATWLSIYPQHLLFNEYGPTEATVAVSQFKLSSDNVHHLDVNVPIGKPGPHMSCFILNHENRLVNQGEIGELHIGGVCLARGYLNRPEQTEKLFIKNPFNEEPPYDRLYKTGDLCRQLPDDTIEYVGRMDEQVKIRGFRIEPGEIEKYLATHPAIAQVVVLIREEQSNEKRLIAYYILKETKKPPTTTQLRQYLLNHLPQHMIPSAFVRIDSLPLTANGKLDRHELPIPRFTNGQHYLAPRTDLEKKLAIIWSDELNIKPIGLKDDFFELGGHSLSAARIVSKINNTLGKNLPLHDFYQAPTIAKLVANIQREKETETELLTDTIDIKQESKLIPLSDFQLMLWMSNTFEPKAKKLNIVSRRRLHGRLNRDALNFAFNAILQKHEILTFHVLKYRPGQHVRSNLSFNTVEKNLESLSEAECELTLTTSIEELMNYYPWPKDQPLLIARLFNLKDNKTELQICMPHVASDDVFPDILLNDLSEFYLMFNDSINMTKNIPDKQYRDYIFNEQQYFKTHIERDIIFWKNYLKDAELFTFSPKMIIRDMADKKLPYSTYVKIPEANLTILQKFCAAHRVSLQDGLCAALALALMHCSNTKSIQSKHYFMNIVKSTRDNMSYDHTIGCFLRLEPIKIEISIKSTFTQLAKQIRQSTIDTNPYQRCSSLVKLACIGLFQKGRRRLRSLLIRFGINLYTILIRNPSLNRKVLKHCGYLFPIDQGDSFIINFNMQRNFILDVNQTKKNGLFGLKLKNTEIYQYDLLNIDNIFDICFFRDSNTNHPYVVISANLKPSHREAIAHEMIHIMTAETLGPVYNLL